MKKIILIIGLIAAGSVVAQTQPTFRAEYFTEIQTNFGEKYNWVNLLSLTAEMPTEKISKHWRNGSFQINTITAYKLFEQSIADDLLGFSNIETDNLPFSLFLFGYEHRWEKVSLFGGVRNVNIDYFTLPFTSFFVNSSLGMYPTIGADFPLANYPLSAICLHFEYQPKKDLVYKISFYNGVAHDPRENIFSVFTANPRRDGVAVMSALNYTQDKVGSGIYALGAFAQIPKFDDITYSIWIDIEQVVYEKDRRKIGFLLQGGAAPQPRNECNYYWAAAGYFQGLLSPKKQDKFGIYVNKAFFTHTTEQTIELTWQYPITEQIILQPAFHYIRTGNKTVPIGLFRVIFSI